MFSRDIIDLAMVHPPRPVLARGIAKAASAYGDSVVRDARSAITWLLERGEAVDRCRQALGMGQPRAVLVHQLRWLAVSLDAVSPAG